MRIAVMRLQGGSGHYLLGLRLLLARTGWAPYPNQQRLCCAELLRDPDHRRTLCWFSPSWPVELDHAVLLTRDGKFALLSQPYGPIKPSDRSYVLDMPAPYGRGTKCLLVTPGRLEANLAAPVAAPASTEQPAS